MLDSRVVFVRHILSFFDELLFLLGALFCLDFGRRKKSRGAGFSRRLKKKNLPSQSKDEKSFVDKHVYLPIPSFSSLFTNTHRMFETFSFLPPLSDADLSKQVQYLLNNGWTPCLEFEDPAHAYTDGHGNSGLDSSINTNYYDNRYWVMWKLPMYGCNDPSEVLAEVKACVKAFPNCYVRCAGFDNIKQVQCHSFLVYRPKLDPMEGGARDVADRQI